jgi:hypothetical protein
MADIEKIIEDVLSNYTINQTINTKDKITKKPNIRYIVMVPKFIANVQPKKRTDHQNDIEDLLKKKIGTSYKKYINVNGRLKTNDSGSFLATTIDATVNKIETTYFIILKEEPSALILLPKLINKKNPVVGVWLTAKEMKDRILEHIDLGPVIPKDKKAYYDLLNNAIKPSTNMIKYDIPKNEKNAEFFELISAINLASLLEDKNTYIVDTLLHMPDKYKNILGKSDIKIFVPDSATTSLMDFFIDFKGVASSNLKQEKKEEQSLKVSVKAKLSAGAEGKFATGGTNTIKIQDLFDKDVKLVEEWYKNLSKYKLSDLQKNQYGPKIVAEAGVESSVTSIGVMYPIRALGKLLSDEKTATAMRNELLKTISYFGKSANDRVVDFKSKAKTPYTNDQVTNAYMDMIIKISSKLLSYRKESPLTVDMATKKNYDIVLLTLPLILKSSVDPKIKENVANIGVICERVLQNASKKGNPTEKHNYYYMFYDQVLGKKHVMYAVATRFGSNQLKFKYLAYANWLQEYNDWKGNMEKAWISLRGKSNPNKLGTTGALGINL